MRKADLEMSDHSTKDTPSHPTDGAAGKRDDVSGEAAGHRFETAATFEAARNVLRTLIFYDLFGSPVLLDELPQRTIGGLPEEWLANPRAKIEADPILSQYVTVARGYVFLRTAPAEFDRWEAAERTRWQCLRRYENWVRVFCRIPFVRMIAVTGSLSFPMPPKKPDCDLFVVAARNRLWIVAALSRLLFLRILPKLRLVKYGEICVNYMVDEDAPNTSSEDLFDSMQMAAMNLVAGQEAYDRLVTSHRGLKRFFPHWFAKGGPAPLFDHTFRSPPRLMRRLAELALWPLPLDRLNRWLYRRLSRRFTLARQRAASDRTPDRPLGQLSTAWVRQAFDLSGELFRFSLQEFKAHGNQKLELLTRYDEALRNHPAAASIDLAGNWKNESKPP